MKNIYKGTLFFLIIVLSASCSKSFLERMPVGQVGKEQLFEDVSGLITALNGSYTLVANYHMAEIGMYGDVRGDDVTVITSPSFPLLNEYNYQSDEEDALLAVSKIWQKTYEALSNINNVINSAEKLRDDFPKQTSRIDSVEGQALVLRALCHFDIAQVYAQHYTYTADGSHLGIPVLSETPYPGTPVKRATMKETYAHILDDLEKAISLMQGNNNTNKITASIEGAKAMRSRLFLYMEKWQDVVDNVNDVMTSNRFELTSASKYEELFISSGQMNESGRTSEVIWQLNLTKMSADFVQVYFSDPVNLVVSPSAKLYALYEDGDVRKSLFKTTPNNKIYSNKYGKESDVAYANWPINYKLFRLSELYLNRAEAYWHLDDFGNAEKDLKRIKARAMGVAEAGVTVTYANKTELLELIKLERRKELAFEGHRIYDIMRYKESLVRGEDCNSATCSLNYPSNKFVLPIPRMELDVNPAMQPNPEVNK